MIYITEDGKQFRSLYEAASWEQTLEKLTAIKAHIDAYAESCHSNKDKRVLVAQQLYEWERYKAVTGIGSEVSRDQEDAP